MYNTRIEWIDSLRGIGIILVVLGHIGVPSSLETFIFSFHMPLFFFLSGYLFSKGKYNSIKEFASIKVYSLMIPYVFFAVISVPIGIVIDNLQKVEIEPIKMVTDLFYLNGSVGWNSPLWFLVCLFIVEIVFFVISRKDAKTICASIVAFFLLGYGATYLNFRQSFGLDIDLVGIVFYAIGYYFRLNNLIEKMNKNKLTVISILVITLVFNIFFGNILNGLVSLYEYKLGNYIYFYIAAIAGTLLMFMLAYNLPKSKLLEYYGKNTLLILSTQYILFWVYRYINYRMLNLGVMDKSSLAVAVVLTIITMLIYIPGGYIFNRFLPFAIGKKKEILIDNSFKL